MKMLNRFSLRVLLLSLATILAFALMQPIVAYTGWPEALQGLKAAAILAWGEMTIIAIRLIVAPKIDVQETVKKIDHNPVACAIVYASIQATWAVRMVLFVVIGWVL